MRAECLWMAATVLPTLSGVRSLRRVRLLMPLPQPVEAVPCRMWVSTDSLMRRNRNSIAAPTSTRYRARSIRRFSTVSLLTQPVMIITIIVVLTGIRCRRLFCTAINSSTIRRATLRIAIAVPRAMILPINLHRMWKISTRTTPSMNMRSISSIMSASVRKTLWWVRTISLTNGNIHQVCLMERRMRRSPGTSSVSQ